MMLTEDAKRELTAAALAVRANAYAPYSSFSVGAALLSSSGKWYVGVNVENASYGLAICAERVAVFGAVTQRDREFTAIALATPGGGTPCGACRQVLAEFAEDLVVLLVDCDRPDEYVETSLSALLPNRFRLS